MAIVGKISNTDNIKPIVDYQTKKIKKMSY